MTVLFELLKGLDMKLFEDILTQVVELTEYFWLWWHIMVKRARVHPDRPEHWYPKIFFPVVDAVRQSFFINAYRLFDKRRDAKSLWLLIAEVEKSNLTLAAQVKNKLAAQAEIVEKVASLRHHVFAHRSKKSPPEDFFTNAKLTPKEMEGIVKLAQEVVVMVAPSFVSYDAKTKLELVESAVLNDTFRVIKTLKEAGNE